MIHENTKDLEGCDEENKTQQRSYERVEPNALAQCYNQNVNAV